MGFSVSSPDLSRLIRQLRDVDPQLAKDAKKKIREAERPAMALVRTSAASFDMTKAAAAVQPANRYTGAGASLAIKVNATIAPNARPLAHPNERGTFNRHPVWGHGPRTSWHWTEQPARKFFDPAADAGFKLCENAMADALDEIVSWLGR